MEPGSKRTRRQLTAVPDLLERSRLRAAFVVPAAAARGHLRTKDPRSVGAEAKAIRDGLLPLLRAEALPFGGDSDALTRQLNEVCRTLAGSLLRWKGNERAFLDGVLEEGEVGYSTSVGFHPKDRGFFEGELIAVNIAPHMSGRSRCVRVCRNLAPGDHDSMQDTFLGLDIALRSYSPGPRHQEDARKDDRRKETHAISPGSHSSFRGCVRLLGAPKIFGKEAPQIGPRSGRQ